MAEHSTLTGASLHEPKGIATAARGQVYIADGAGGGTWVALNTDYSTSPINEQTGTAYTLVLTDVGKTIELNNSAANKIVIPTNASVSFIIGSWLNVVRVGAGVTSIMAASGVELNGVNGGSAKITARWAGISLRKRGTNSWGLVGIHDTVS